MPFLADNAGAPVPTLPQAINSHAGVHPSRTAIEDEYRTLTWRALLAECIAMADGLTRRGIARLGIAAGNESGHLVALIAAAATGIPAVPVARDWTAEDIGRRLDAAGVDLVLCSPGDEDRIRSVTQAPVEAVERQPTPAQAPGDRLLPGGDFADLHLIASTGGTSGRLKFAHLTHGNTVARFITQVIEFGLQRRGRFLCMTPLFHGGGRSFSLCHLYLGGTVVLRERFDSAAWLRQVRDCTASFIVPTMATRILDAATQPLDPGLRIIISGARLDPSIAARWKERVGGAMFNYYGSVEVGAIAVATMDELLHARRPDFVGLPAFGVHLDFGTDEAGGEAWSEVSVSGPSVAVGVEIEGSAPRTTTQLNPGDLLISNPEGHLYYNGRADDVIITGGVNVYPGLVEAVFRGNDAIAELALIGLPHPEWGEELVLVVTPREGREIREEDLRRVAAAKLARAAQPKRYRIMPRLPLTTAGKIDRRALIAVLSGAMR